VNDRVAEMRRRLETALAPERLEIIDDSAQHVGHAGAQGGGGHYTVTIVSQIFAGQSSIERHRQVYQALGELMGRDIHALCIDAHTPDEL